MSAGAVVTYLTFDDTAYYDSARGTNWTATGSHISLNTTGGYNGKGCVQFASNDHSYLSSTSLNLANNDFEISFWVRISNRIAQQQVYPISIQIVEITMLGILRLE